VIFVFIDAEKANHDVTRMCSVLGVSRSGYYAWRARGASKSSQDDQALVGEIVQVHAESRQLYGSPRVHAELRRRGRRHGRKRVARLMRACGLQARRRHKYRRSSGEAHFPFAPNVLDRRFAEVSRSGEVWVGDVTYVRTSEGWLYLAVVIDVYTRRVVGWATGATPDGDLTVRAYEAATMTTSTTPELFHSDRGSEYSCADLRATLQEDGVTQSMSRSGDCWDNAVAESFFATLKRELVHLTSFSTRKEARASVFSYIESFYNRVRLHSALGYRSPMEFELEAGVGT
jgi:transposase InsO family protein